MTGWLVKIKIEVGTGRQSARWAVACKDWLTATQIAKIAYGVDDQHLQRGIKILNTRAVRAATPEELVGLADGEARRVR